MDYMDDERLALYEQQRAEARRTDASQLGLVGMSLVPVVFMGALLCYTLRLILEQRMEAHQNGVEAKRLEDLLLDAGRRAPKGVIMPTEKLLEVYGRE